MRRPLFKFVSRARGRNTHVSLDVPAMLHAFLSLDSDHQMALVDSSTSSNVLQQHPATAVAAATKVVGMVKSTTRKPAPKATGAAGGTAAPAAAATAAASAASAVQKLPNVQQQKHVAVGQGVREGRRSSSGGSALGALPPAPMDTILLAVDALFPQV